MNLLELQKKLFGYNDTLVQLTELYNKDKKELTNKINLIKEKIDLSKNNLNLDKIELAETIMSIFGSYKEGTGDKYSCVYDGIYWFTNLEPNLHCRELTQEYYGCKNYDRWTAQRSDHSYGYGPNHGSIIFSIGLKNRKKELTEEDREACIYYLLNLEKIQQIKNETNTQTKIT